VFVISGCHLNIESTIKLLLGEGGFEFRVLTMQPWKFFLFSKRRQISQILRSSSPAYLCLASQIPKLKNHKYILNKQAAVL